MKLVEAHVEKRQAEFTKHAFFSDDRLGTGIGGALSVAPDLTFWVMAFQDVLRLNAVLTIDRDRNFTTKDLIDHLPQIIEENAAYVGAPEDE